MVSRIGAAAAVRCMERLCVSWSDWFDRSSSNSNSSNGEACTLRDSDAITVTSALHNVLRGHPPD
jgi:hypothetical protein